MTGRWRKRAKRALRAASRTLRGERHRYAEEVTKHELRALVDRQDPIILEIGSNDGTDSAEFLDVFTGCRLHCFECDARAIQKFERNVKDPRCTLYRAAMSDRDGTATLHLSGGTPGPMFDGEWDRSSSLLAPKECLDQHPWLRFEERAIVPTTRLDTWAAAHLDERIVDLVWMDVQGAEYLVIEGGGATLARTRFCYFEYDERETYEGQKTLETLLRSMKTFVLLATYAGRNALVANSALGADRRTLRKVLWVTRRAGGEGQAGR